MYYRVRVVYVEGGDGEIVWLVLIRDRSSVVGNRRGREWGDVFIGFFLKVYLVRFYFFEWFMGWVSYVRDGVIFLFVYCFLEFD